MTQESDKGLAAEVISPRYDLRPLYPPQAVDLLRETDPSERNIFWQNFDQLDASLAQATLQKPPQNVADILTIFQREISQIAPAETRFAGLDEHLLLITKQLDELLRTNEAGPRESNLRFLDLIDVQSSQTLIDLVAPLHDLLKYLSKPEGQITFDHEVVTAYLLRKHFGHFAELAKQVEFAAKVIEDHENIYRETDRSDLIFSAQVEQRAKAIFFIADVLTGVIDFRQNPAAIDQDTLADRFTDLYFRHIDLLKGKVFRPEWGLYAIRDITTTLSHLVASHGLIIEVGWQTKLVEAAMRAVDQAKRGESQFTLNQVERLNQAELQLEWQNQTTASPMPELLAIKLRQAFPERWPNLPLRTLQVDCLQYASLNTLLAELDQLQRQVEIMVGKPTSSEGMAVLKDILSDATTAAAKWRAMIASPDGVLAAGLLTQFPLLGFLIRHQADSNLTTQDYLQPDLPVNQFNSALAEKSLVRMTQSFLEMAQVNPDLVWFADERLRQVLYVTILHLDVAKGGSSQIRQYWERRKGLNFLAHNRASAMLLSEDKPLLRSIERAFNSQISPSQVQTLHQLLIQMVEYHGLVGQYVRGEVTELAFAGLTDWVMRHHQQIDELIEAMNLGETTNRAQFITELYHLINYIDTASVRPGLMTPALADQFSQVMSQFHQVLAAPIESEVHWRQQYADIPNRPELASCETADKQRLALADRISRLRGHRDHDEVLGFLLEQSDELVAKVFALFERAQFWYVENATSHLSVENQLKLLALFVRAGWDWSKLDNTNFDLNFAPLMNTTRPSGQPRQALIKSLDVFLYKWSLIDVMQGKLEVDRSDQEWKISLFDGANQASSLVISPARLSYDSQTSFSIDLKLESTINHALQTIEAYYRQPNRADVAVIRSAIDLLSNNLGLKLDDWDRLFDQELYMANMDANMPKKIELIRPVVERLKAATTDGLSVMGIGSGTGELELALAKYLTDGDLVLATDVSRVMVEHTRRYARIMRGRNFLIDHNLLDAGKSADLRVLKADASSSDFVEEVEQAVERPINLVCLFSVLHELASYTDDGYQYAAVVEQVLANSLKAVAQTGGSVVIRDFLLADFGGDHQYSDNVTFSFGDFDANTIDPKVFLRRFADEFPGFVGDERAVLAAVIDQLDADPQMSSISLPYKLAHEVYAHYSWMKSGKSQKEMFERYGYLTVSQLKSYLAAVASQHDLEVEIEVDVRPENYETYVGTALVHDQPDGLVNMGLIEIKVKSN